jgi:cytidylate kinase
VVIAIDGPSGVGKSTVSRGVAAALGIAYLDTGSYYRAVTLVALGSGADPGDEAAILAALAATRFEVVDGSLSIDGTDIAEAIRGPDVTAAVSEVAAHPQVRVAVVQMQRDWAADQSHAAVIEGRDIGTVVFPDAPVKVFLTADPLVRAERRAGDAESDGKTVEELADEMRRRDSADSTRETSPLRPADDAVTIDTSHLTIAEVIERILDLVGAAGLSRR